MGCDVTAPSIDGRRIGKIRKSLDKNNHQDVQIISQLVCIKLYDHLKIDESKKSLKGNNYQVVFKQQAMRETFRY